MSKFLNDSSIHSLDGVPHARGLFFNPSTGKMHYGYSQRMFSIMDYGAKADGRILTGGAATTAQSNPSFTGAGFTNADIGKALEVIKLSTGESFTGVILSVTNSTTVVLDANSNFTGSSGVIGYLGTDDTAAWQAALQACVDNGGGIVFYPNGISIVNGPLINNIYGGANPNCQIVIPQIATTSTGGQPVSIRIMGECAPVLSDSGLYDLKTQTWGKGAIIKSTRAGSGTRPAVFGAVGIQDGFGAFNPTDVSFENVWIRTKPGGSMGGYNLGLTFNTPACKNMKVDTTVTGFLTTSPAAGVYGMIPGQTDGGTFYRMENTLVVGYENAYLLGEHATGNNVQAMCCKNAFVFQGGSHHLINIDRFCAYWCKNIFVADGLVGGYANIFGTLDIEFRQASVWYDSDKGVVDPNNHLFGKVRYHSVTSSVGADQTTFTKTGGTNLLCKSIYEA